MKNDIIKYYYTINSFAQTGRKFEISRQRVHQIVTGYKSFAQQMSHSLTKSKTHYKKTEGIRGLLLLNCKKCDKPRRAIHHRDGNYQNNALLNLMPLCTSCHKAIHVKNPRRTINQAQTA